MAKTHNDSTSAALATAFNIYDEMRQLKAELRERAEALDEMTRCFHFEVDERTKVVLQLEATLEELHDVADALTTAANTINEGQCQNCGNFDPLRNNKWGGYYA